MTAPVPGWLALVALVVLLAACSLVLPSVEQPTQVELRTWPADTVGGDCPRARIGTVELSADPNAEVGRQVWLVSDEGVLWPVWPYGWTGYFAPDLRILNREGEVVLQEGDSFHAGGTIRRPRSAWVCEIDRETVL